MEESKNEYIEFLKDCEDEETIKLFISLRDDVHDKIGRGYLSELLSSLILKTMQHHEVLKSLLEEKDGDNS